VPIPFLKSLCELPPQEEEKKKKKEGGKKKKKKRGVGEAESK